MDNIVMLESEINKDIFDKFLTKDLFLESSGKDCIKECTKTDYYKMLLNNPDEDDDELYVIYFTCHDTTNDDEICLSCQTVDVYDDENSVIVIDKFEIRLTRSKIFAKAELDPLKHSSFMRKSIKQCFNRLISIF